jgi:pimeloyl-ACP methyl ester carboxylesterase
MAPTYDPEKMTLNYERIGNGPKKMVLRHGLTGSLKYWKTGLDDLPDFYSLLLIDLLGFGDSTKPNSKYDLEEHLGAIEKVIKKEGFDSGDAIVMGHQGQENTFHTWRKRCCRTD